MRRMLMTAATALFWHSMEISVQTEAKAAAAIMMPMQVENTSRGEASKEPISGRPTAKETARLMTHMIMPAAVQTIRLDR